MKDFENNFVSYAEKMYAHITEQEDAFIYERIFPFLNEISKTVISKQDIKDAFYLLEKKRQGKLIELPANPATKVYVIDRVYNTIYDTTLLNVRLADLKYTFLTFQEAEEKLKELNEK